MATEPVSVTFWLPGRPVPWERVRTNHGKFFKPKRTRDYEDAIALVARNQRTSFPDGPVAVHIGLHSGRRPLMGDIDNYAKSVLDGLQIGGMFDNDRQVKDLTIYFEPNTEDKTVITVQGYVRSESNNTSPGLKEPRCAK